MNIINIITIVKKYKFSILKIVFYEIFFILRGFKGNKVDFAYSNDFNPNIPCPYYFLVKIKKFLINTNIKSFLDLGCGNGRVIYFFNNFLKIKYFGIEFIEKPYNSCKLLFAKNQNIQIKNDDFRNLKFLINDIDCFFINEPLKNKKDFEIVVNKIYEKYSKNNKIYYIILINVSKDDLNFCSNLDLVDSEIINTRGYYIFSNKKNIK